MQSSAAVLEASIVALVLGLALRGSPREVRFFACRPRLLFRAFVAMDVLLPLFTMSALSALSMPAPVTLGATLLAISPGASLIAQKELRPGGRGEFVLASSMLGSLLAIASVPIWLGIASELLLPDASLSPSAVMRLVTTLFVLPLTLALVLRRLAPDLMRRASGPLIVAADVMLLIALLSFAGEIVPGLRRLGLGGAGAIAASAAGAVMLGHLAGGRDASDRSVLAVMSGARHPGLALLIARFNFAGDLVLPAVVASLLIGTLLTLPYAFWRRRQRRRVDNSAATLELAPDAPILAPAPPASQ
jgi:predicted Na+-dependent transporter